MHHVDFYGKSTMNSHWLVLLLTVTISNCIRPLPFHAELIPDEVSAPCHRQFKDYFDNLKQDKDSWALRMFDATGKLPSGPLWLQILELGKFEQCIGVTGKGKSGIIMGKYCLGVLNSRRKIKNRDLSKEHNFWAFCIPHECTEKDAEVMGNFVLTRILGPVVNVGFPPENCQTAGDINSKLTKGSHIAIGILGGLLGIVVLTTFIEICCLYFSQRTCPLIIKAFSAYSNCDNIFKISHSGDQLLCLHGLKFLATLCIVYVHQINFAHHLLINLSWLNKQAHGSLFCWNHLNLAVETFFTVSGTVISFGFFTARRRKVPFNLTAYYLHRYLRLTPPLAMIVLIYATFWRYTGSGPLVNKLIDEQADCNNYWWATIFYIETFYEYKDWCIGQTWYLSVDMQLYFLSPIFLLTLWKCPKLGIVLCCGSIFASMGTLYSVHRFGGTTYNTQSRAVSWLIGILLGYFVFKIKHDSLTFRIGKITALLIWILCLSTMVACAIYVDKSVWSTNSANAIHKALIRPVWSLMTAWIILSETLDRGGPICWLLSWPVYQVLNKFAYGIYLIHASIIYTSQDFRKLPNYFSFFELTGQFFGTVAYSSLLSFPLVLMTESPIPVLEKLIFGTFKKEENQNKNRGKV